MLLGLVQQYCGSASFYSFISLRLLVSTLRGHWWAVDAICSSVTAKSNPVPEIIWGIYMYLVHVNRSQTLPSLVYINCSQIMGIVGHGGMVFASYTGLVMTCIFKARVDSKFSRAYNNSQCHLESQDSVQVNQVNVNQNVDKIKMRLSTKCNFIYRLNQKWWLNSISLFLGK